MDVDLRRIVWTCKEIRTGGNMVLVVSLSMLTRPSHTASKGIEQHASHDWDVGAGNVLTGS